MSRISLTRPRRNRAVWDHPAPGTRLLPTPYPLTMSLGNPLPGDGRSTDYTRQALSKGPCRYNAPLNRCVYVAPMRIDGEFPEPANVGLRCRATEPLSDSTTVTAGLLRSVNHGVESMLPTHNPVELYGWAERPPTIPSTLSLQTMCGAAATVNRAESHGPSIASPSLPSASHSPAHPVGDAPRRESIPSPVGAAPRSLHPRKEPAC